MADTTILSWITVEVDQALERVRKQLATCAQGSVDASAVAGCTEHLHQVSGALSMVGLAGATRFCEALESSIPGLTAAANEAVPVLDRAAFELKQFVNDVARGDPNVPLRLYPSYRELAQLQGRKDCSEIELFFPDLTPPAPTHPSPKALEVGELTAFLQSQRTRWQRAILAWIRRQPHALEEMRATLDAIHAVAHQLPERRALWWVAGGLVDTLVDEAEPARLAHARSRCNKLDLYVRDLAAGAPPDNEPLLRELLYAVAGAAPLTPRLRDIKRLYSLDALVPATRPAATADTAGLQEDIRSKLQALGQAWQRYLAGDASGAANMRERVATLQSAAEALGESDLSTLFAAVAAAAARLPSAVEPGSDFLLLEMASAFLLAQAMVESLAAPPADTAEQVSHMVGWLEQAEPGKPAGAPPTGLRPELTQHVSALQLRSRVAGEILANLQQIEQALDAYARGHGGKDALTKVAPQLRQIDGALRVLDWERAGAVLERCERMIGALTPGSADMDWLAEGLSSLSLYVTPCVQGREPREQALDVFLHRIQERALPKPAASPAPAAAAPDETLLQIFLDEANDVLAMVAASLDACRAAPANLDELAAVRRGFHTMKGSGRMVGLSELGEAAWRVEHAYNEWLDREAPASPELLDVAAVAHGCLTGWIAQLRAGESPSIDMRPISDALARLAGDDSAIKRVRDVYLKEAKQHVATLEDQWTEWRAKSSGNVSPEFTRAAHTLASSSRTARFEGVAQLAAELEQWVPLAERTVDPADQQAVGQAIAALANMLDAVGRDESPAPSVAALAAVQGVRGRLLVPPRPKEKRVMRDDLDDALLPIFVEEAEELAPQLSAALAAWRANRADGSAPDALKRALHTLKGSARMAGAIRLGELTHLMESRIEYALEAGEVIRGSHAAREWRASRPLDQRGGRRRHRPLPRRGGASPDQAGAGRSQ
ncbi:MAG: Hpt domain-containing protein [Betaproteobacteria bacterium]|nr:Hpt domain-containing protein [Betaproteobacteria bacterium]